MSSIDPLLLLAGKQPKKTTKVKREEIAPVDDASTDLQNEHHNNDDEEEEEHIDAEAFEANPVDPFLLLAGRQPRKKARARREAAPADADEVAEPRPEQHENEEQAVVEPPRGTVPSPAKARPGVPPPKPKKRESVPFQMSLTDRCRTVIVNYLERYPPESLGFLDPEEWSTLIERRHKKTTPTRGSGGLDGTGRLTPAVPERYIESVEDANPHLQTQKTDVLVWKDCVNMRFRSGGLTRPRILEKPWPFLVDEISQLGQALESKHPPNHAVIERLQLAPMNVALLKATGVGKAVKKVTKTIKKESGDDDPSGALDRLMQLLNKWKDLAAQQDKKSKNDEDWILAENCHTWRDLYHGLAQREESVRSAQGQRMREIRANLNADRPKVVKVQRAKKSHSRILAGASGSSSSSFVRNGAGPAAHTTNSKLQKIRQETAAITQRSVVAGRSVTPGGGFSAPQSNFARAVAVAACAKRKGNAAPSASSIMSKRLKMSKSPPPRRPPTQQAPRSSFAPSALRKTPKSMPPPRKNR